MDSQPATTQTDTSMLPGVSTQLVDEVEKITEGLGIHLTDTAKLSVMALKLHTLYEKQKNYDSLIFVAFWLCQVANKTDSVYSNLRSLAKQLDVDLPYNPVIDTKRDWQAYTDLLEAKKTDQDELLVPLFRQARGRTNNLSYLEDAKKLVEKVESAKPCSEFAIDYRPELKRLLLWSFWKNDKAVLPKEED